MDKAKVIDKLNEILRHEWTGVAQYAQSGFVISGLWREVFSGVFMESAQECFGHAKSIADKIVALGGVPTVERNPIQQSSDVHEMLEMALTFESTAVRQYTEAIGLSEDDRALTVFLEDILVEEQEGVDTIGKYLRDHGAATATHATAKTG